MSEDTPSIQSISDQKERQRLELLGSIRINIDSLLQHTAEDICARPILGSINFIELSPQVGQALDVLVRYKSLRLEVLPHLILAEVSSRVASINGELQKLLQFRLDDPQQQENPGVRRNNIQNAVESRLNSQILEAQKYYPVPHSFCADSQDTAEMIRKTLNEAKEAASSLRVLQQEIELVANRAKEAAGEVGVSAHAAVFEQQAKSHAIASWCWIGLTVLLLIATISLATVLFHGTPLFVNETSVTCTAPSGDLDTRFVRDTLIRLVTLSICYFAIVWAARNYRANCHLRAVNQHRSNALKTFEIFVKQASDTQIRDAVLVESTKCIFAPSTTGYLGPEEELPANRFIDVASHAMGKGKS